MTNLPEELFTAGNSSDKREYYFINLDGKEESVELDFGDRLSKTKCPLDGANLVIYNGDPHTIIECPACREHFENDYTSDILYIKNSKIIPRLEINLTVLKNKINHLEQLLKLAKDSNNSIKEANISNEIYSKYNQDNLSAKKGGTK
jgi:hypothetical protein